MPISYKRENKNVEAGNGKTALYTVSDGKGLSNLAFINDRAFEIMEGETILSFMQCGCSVGKRRTCKNPGNLPHTGYTRIIYLPGFRQDSKIKKEYYRIGFNRSSAGLPDLRGE
jgi:hypothetical protein